MALNPQLFPNGMPVPFVNELFVLARDGVEFEVDKIPGSASCFLYRLKIVALCVINCFRGFDDWVLGFHPAEVVMEDV